MRRLLFGVVVVLLVAGGDDIVADVLGVSIFAVVYTLRVLVIVLPIATALFTWKLCRDVKASGHVEEADAETEPPIAPFQLPTEEPVVEPVLTGSSTTTADSLSPGRDSDPLQ